MKALIPTFLWGLILAVLITAQFHTVAEAVRFIPQAVLLENPYGLGLSLSEYLSVSGELTVTAALTERGYVSMPDKPGLAHADLTYTDSRYGNLMGLDIIRGAFLPNGSFKCAVISDKLAVEYFMSLDITGTEITVDGTVYSICGIYRERTSLTARLSQNGRTEVFLSLADYPNAEEPVRKLFVPVGSSGLTAQAANQAAAELEAAILPTEQKNYYQTYRLAAQGVRLQWLILGLLTGGLLLIAFTKRFISVIRELHTAISGYDIISDSDKKRVFRQIVVCILCLLAALLILFFASFDIYIPGNWVRTIMESGDIGFVTAVRKLNATPYSFLETYAHRVLTWVYFAVIMTLLSGFCWIRSCCKAIHALLSTP